MLMLHDSHYNKGVSHISGFWVDSSSYNNKRLRQHLCKLVEEAKDKLIQITLREDQIKQYRDSMVEMYKLGFVPAYRHINPNTNAMIRMFVRKPDLPEGFKAEVLTKWEAFKYPHEDSMGMITLSYHQGGCCGYSDVFGFSTDKGVLSYQGYDNHYQKEQSKAINILIRRIALLRGEMAMYSRPGMAFQMFMPDGMILNSHYSTAWRDAHIRNVGFEKVYSYLCPTNKTKMDLIIASSNKQPKETWEEISSKFHLNLFNTKKKEKKPVNPMYPPRDEYGRFASRNRGLGMDVGNIAAASPAFGLP